jgi:hypothetical protein
MLRGRVTLKDAGFRCWGTNHAAHRCRVGGSLRKSPSCDAPKIHPADMASSAERRAPMPAQGKALGADRATPQGLKARPIRIHGLHLRTVSCQIDPLSDGAVCSRFMYRFVIMFWVFGYWLSDHRHISGNQDRYSSPCFVLIVSCPLSSTQFNQLNLLLGTLL